MKITIAICTWNRCRLLRQTLNSLTALSVPAGTDWEVLVVDNRSTDSTPHVIHSFRDTLPLRYVFESRQGHSVSRNAAVAEASGEYILWTDNDVIVDRNWAAAYLDGFHRFPEAAYFGGKILPVFEAGMPEWLAQTWAKCRAVYAARDLGEREMTLAENVYPYGANFAIRLEVQRQFLFDADQGRKGHGMLGEDEIAVLRRIHEAGYSGVWLPRAIVQHVIPANRATPAYVRRYFIGQGHNNIVQGKVRKSAGQALRESVSNQVAWLRKRPFARPEEWVSHLIRAGLSWGEFRELLRQGNSPG
jgi:glycosyltransferase involved in cell wall biosynthesis